MGSIRYWRQDRFISYSGIPALFLGGLLSKPEPLRRICVLWRKRNIEFNNAIVAFLLQRVCFVKVGLLSSVMPPYLTRVGLGAPVNTRTCLFSVTFPRGGRPTHLNGVLSFFTNWKKNKCGWGSKRSEQ